MMFENEIKLKNKLKNSNPIPNRKFRSYNEKRVIKKMPKTCKHDYSP